MARISRCGLVLWACVGVVADKHVQVVCDRDGSDCAAVSPSLLATKVMVTRGSSSTDLSATASDALWLKMTAYSNDLEETESVMQELATRVVSGTEKLSDAQKELLKTLKDELTKISDNLIVDHAEDQNELDAAKVAIDNCDGETSVIASGAASAGTAMSAIDTCKDVEATNSATNTASCDSYTAIAGNPNAPPCMKTFDTEYQKPVAAGKFDAMITCVGEIKTWAEGYHATLVTKKDTCDTAAATFSAKKTECDAAQSAGEAAFCSYRQTVETACASYETCRTTAVTAKDTAEANIKLDEAARKVTKTSIVMVTCYLGVLEAAKDEAAGKLDACKAMVPDTSSLNINYPATPAGVGCSTSAVATFPCEAAWVNTHYNSKAWATNAPAVACTPCPALTLPGGSTVASGATTPWKLGMNINPSDGHNFGWGAEWDNLGDVGSASEALTKDFKDKDVWEKVTVKYIAIVRHSGASCEASKVWKLDDQTKTMYAWLKDEIPGRFRVTSSGPVYKDVPDGLTGKGEDPFFATNGKLIFNWWYSNNGARIAVDDAYVHGALPGEGDNTDDLHGFGNEFGANTRNGQGSNSWWHDVGVVQPNCHGGSCKVQGTDKGSSLKAGAVLGSYAIYVTDSSDSNPTFPCQGTTLERDLWAHAPSTASASPATPVRPSGLELSQADMVAGTFGSWKNMQLDDPSAKGVFKIFMTNDFGNRFGTGVAGAVATPTFGARDHAHQKSMLRSPIFVVGSSPCTVTCTAMGGSGPRTTYKTASDTWLGILWREASAAKGTYLGGAWKSENYQHYGGNAWRDISVTISTPGSYTIDAADFHSGGGYGWVAFKEVTFSAGCR